MIGRSSPALVLALAIALGASPARAKVTAPAVDRPALDRLEVHWTDSNPVDVFETSSSEADIGQAMLVSKANRTGIYATPASAQRRYFLLRDTRDGSVVRVAERLIPLEHGSNFRNIGGYPAADGKHVRWGVLFRSGATPLLTDKDVASIKALGIVQLVDLRSSQERTLAPTKLDGIAYSAVGYSQMVAAGAGVKPDMEAVYRDFPTLLAPQMRLLFRALLNKETPVAYNCSAGQDRTGFATALILTTLGVSRDVIEQDYHLSTVYRQPGYEMPKIDPAQHPNDPIAALFARSQTQSRKPMPLYDSQHRAFLFYALDEMEKRWGGVEGYLQKEIGVGPTEIAALRATYLE